MRERRNETISLLYSYLPPVCCYTLLIRLEPNPFPIEQSHYVVVAAAAAAAVRPFYPFFEAGRLPRIGE